MNKKKTMIAVAVFIILAIGAGVLAWKKNEIKKQEALKIQQKQAETQRANIEKVAEIDTSDWKTYKNEDLGFEIKYPKDWYVKVDGENSSKVIGNKFIIFSNYAEKISKDNNPGDALLVFINTYDKSNLEGMTEYDRVKKYTADLSEKVDATSLPDNRGTIEVFGVFKNNVKRDVTWDMAKPVVKGFLSGSERNFVFYHGTELGNTEQEKSAYILRKMLKTFRLL